MRLHEAVRRYPLFNLLKLSWLEAWLERAEPLSVDTGETLIRAGTPGHHTYFVESGRVRALRIDHAGREVPVGSFGPGELFGEYALVPPRLNTATCRASTACRLVRLPLQPIADALQQLSDVKRHLKSWLRLHALVAYLRDQCCLGFMSAKSFLPLRDRCTTLQFQAGDAIQADGLSADRWFVVVRGQVSVCGPAGESHERVRVLGPGDSFGERALVDGWRVDASQAELDTECLSLRRNDVCLARGGNHPEEKQTFRVTLPPPRSYPWVSQCDVADCGAAALAMVLRYYLPAAATDVLRQCLTPGSRGTSLFQLERAAARLGFLARAVRIAPLLLAEAALPAIAHLADGHYVVVFAVSEHETILGDPAQGVVTVATRAFRQSWSGHILLLTPTPRTLSATPTWASTRS